MTNYHNGPSDSSANDDSASVSSDSDMSPAAETSDVKDQMDDVDDEPLSGDAGDDVDNTTPGWISLQGDFLTTANLPKCMMNYLQHPPAGAISFAYTVTLKLKLAIKHVYFKTYVVDSS